MRIECRNPEAVVKEAFWLAWQACGGPRGMGIFQDKPDATKEEVWDNIERKGDYPNPHGMATIRTERMYADYVFGRMMKVGFEYDETAVAVPDWEPTPGYQGWCHLYPTYQSLIEAAISALNRKEN